MSQDHSHDHHSHDHGGDHARTFQPDDPEPRSREAFLGLALDELLREKGVYTAAELTAKITEIEAITPALGARLVARAWVDDGFRRRLLADAAAACRELDIEPGYAELTALENTPDVHNVVVCTLCSCYPRSVLGLPPAWYKSAPYRARVVREPRAVLREFGLEIAADRQIRVHDSTAELRYIVVPMRPPGTDGLDEAALADLVTRDAMVGVAEVAPPSPSPSPSPSPAG